MTYVQTPEEIEIDLTTPETLPEVSAVLCTILNAWTTVAEGLAAEMRALPDGPMGAMQAAVKGGAFGILSQVVLPTIGNLADAIDGHLNDLEAQQLADDAARVVDL